MEFIPEQLDVIQAPLTSRIFLEGEAGSGKTTAGVQRLLHLCQEGIPGESILILTPQRSLAKPYYEAVNAPEFPGNGLPTIVTFGGLAQRMISLFWPVIAQNAGFSNPKKSPGFLTLETAQYYLASIVDPLFQQGYFDSITIDQNRLFSQILDNLNKSAIVGFDPGEIATRLASAWAGKPSQTIVFEQARECAVKFRQFCYQNNLLDFSLQIEVFVDHLWPSLICQNYLKRSFHHIIYENVEEDFPVAHDILYQWLPDFGSVLLIKDTEGGFRSFLGADPVSSTRLKEVCPGSVRFTKSWVKSESLHALDTALNQSIRKSRLDTIDSSFSDCFSVHSFRFYPEVMDWIADEINNLVQQHNIDFNKIAILTPFLSDSLRFSFMNRLQTRGLPVTTYRPSRSLRDEPAVRTILTLAKIANPAWGLTPSSQEIRSAFMHTIEGCDIIRADLMSQMLFSRNTPLELLRSFDPVNTEMRSRITYSVGEKFEILRGWISSNLNQGSTSLDYFISRLFGEVLSRSGFGLHADFESASTVSHLIESCRKFRQIVLSDKSIPQEQVGKEFIRVLEQGILAAQSYTSWVEQTGSNAVFLSPAFSYLMNNQPSRIQFWVDIGSQGWWSRLDQPLTQPYVLNRNWPPGAKWTDEQEFLNNQNTLARVVSGLIRRCSSHIYLVSVGVNEQGLEERGALVMAVQTILRSIKNSESGSHV